MHAGQGRAPHRARWASLHAVYVWFYDLPMSLREAHKDRTRSALVESAHAGLERHGIEQLTADLVAEGAGVSRRTLFNYFGSVEEALLAPAQVTMDTLLAALQEADPSTPLLDVLREALPEVFDAQSFARIARIWRVAETSGSLHRTEASVIGQCVQTALDSVVERYAELGLDVDRMFLAGLARSGLGAIETASEAWREQTDPDAPVDEASRQLFLELAQRALDDLRSGYACPLVQAASQAARATEQHPTEPTDPTDSNDSTDPNDSTDLTEGRP